MLYNNKLEGIYSAARSNTEYARSIAVPMLQQLSSVVGALVAKAVFEGDLLSLLHNTHKKRIYIAFMEINSSKSGSQKAPLDLTLLSLLFSFS